MQIELEQVQLYTHWKLKVNQKAHEFDSWELKEESVVTSVKKSDISTKQPVIS